MDRTIPTSIVAKNMLTTRNRSLRRPLVKDRVSFLWKRDGIVSFGPAIVRGLIGIAIAIDPLGLDQVISRGLSIPCVLPVLLVIGSSPLIPTALTLFF